MTIILTKAQDIPFVVIASATGTCVSRTLGRRRTHRLFTAFDSRSGVDHDCGSWLLSSNGLGKSFPAGIMICTTYQGLGCCIHFILHLRLNHVLLSPELQLAMNLAGLS